MAETALSQSPDKYPKKARMTSGIQSPIADPSTESLYTNFCLAFGCLIPLAPKEIKGHIQMHKESGISLEIETIADIRTKCRKKIQDTVKIIKDEQAIINNSLLAFGNPQEIALIRLYESRDKLLKEINKYYEDLEKQIINQSKELYSLESKTENTMIKLDKLLTRLLTYSTENEKLLISLSSADKSINTMREILKRDFESEIEEMKYHSHQLLNSLKHTKLNICIDGDSIQRIKTELTKYVYVDTSSKIFNDVLFKNIPKVQPNNNTINITTYPNLTGLNNTDQYNPNSEKKYIPNENIYQKSSAPYVNTPNKLNKLYGLIDNNERNSFQSNKNMYQPEIFEDLSEDQGEFDFNAFRPNSSVIKPPEIKNTKSNAYDIPTYYPNGYNSAGITKNSNLFNNTYSKPLIYQDNHMQIKTENNANEFTYPYLLPSNEASNSKKVFDDGKYKMNAADRNNVTFQTNNTLNLQKININGGLSIRINDYFISSLSNKWLYFFHDNTKKLSLMNIGKINLTTGIPNEFEEIELQIDFKIPIWHKSLITSDGHIYLTGGSIPNLEGHKTSSYNKEEIYIYDHLQRTLKLKGKLQIARNCHAMCYLQNNIYIIGGCTEKSGYTIECEKFMHDPTPNVMVKSYKICSLNNASCAPSVATYNDKYIFKFGGIMSFNDNNCPIERYDPYTDKWTLINFKSNIGYTFNDKNPILYGYSGAIQINPYEIIIFGGGERETKTKQTLLFKETDKDNFTLEQTIYDLPYVGTFWTNPLICDKNVFCLQTIQTNPNDIFCLSKRIIFYFNGSKWIEVPTK